MEELSDEATVLLAIIESHGYVTPDDVERRAKKIDRASDDVVYSGPKPEFTQKSVFSEAWNELLSTDRLREVGSTQDNRPKFDNKPCDAIDHVCDGFNEKLSFDAIIHNKSLEE